MVTANFDERVSNQTYSDTELLYIIHQSIHTNLCGKIQDEQEVRHGKNVDVQTEGDNEPLAENLPPPPPQFSNFHSLG